MAKPQDDRLVRVGTDAFQLLEGFLGGRGRPAAPLPLIDRPEGTQVRRYSGMVLLDERFRFPPREDAFQLLEGFLGGRGRPAAPLPLTDRPEGTQVRRRYSGMVLLDERFRLPPREVLHHPLYLIDQNSN